MTSRALEVSGLNSYFVTGRRLQGCSQKRCAVPIGQRSNMPVQHTGAVFALNSLIEVKPGRIGGYRPLVDQAARVRGETETVAAKAPKRADACKLDAVAPTWDRPRLRGIGPFPLMFAVACQAEEQRGSRSDFYLAPQTGLESMHGWLTDE